jgi:hypothetical protein
VEVPTNGARLAVSSRRWPWQPATLFAIPILAAGWFWHPLVHNYFSQDDFVDLFLICNLSLGKYLLTPHAGHVYLVRNAIYYIVARLFGTNTDGYFTVVWCTHLLNVGLLFWTVERFTRSAWLACFAAFLFGTCPVLEGSLGWFAVFGHVEAATALLLVLVDAGRLAARDAPLTRARRWLWGAITLASVTMFGVSIGVAMALPFALAILVPADLRRGTMLPLWPLIIVVPLVYLGSLWVYSHLFQTVALAEVGTLATDSASRPSQMVAYAFGLVAYGIDRLLAGPLPLPPCPAAAGTVVAAAAAIVGLWSLRYGPSSARRLLLAAAFLTAACYGTIAAGRTFLLHLLGFAASVAQLRYHYVGIATMALGVAAAALSLAKAIPWLAQIRAAMLVACLGVWLGAVLLWPLAIDHHDDTRKEVMFVIAWMRSLARQTPADEDVYIRNRGFYSVSPFFFSRREFPGWAGVFSIYFPDPSIDGRRVFFVEPDPTVRTTLRTARRLEGVLVAPEAVPLLPEPLTPIDPLCSLPSAENALAQSP